MVKKPDRKFLLKQTLEKMRAYIWRKLRNELNNIDKRENVTDGLDIIDFFGPRIIDLSNIIPTANLIKDIVDSYEEFILIGVERKGYALLGAILDEIGRNDIKIKRSRKINQKDVEGRNLILFDDASNTGTRIMEEANRMLDFGAHEILAIVVLSTDIAIKRINKFAEHKHLQFFPSFSCKEEDYSKIYSTFYQIVNASLIPVTGESFATIKIKHKDINLLPDILKHIRRGEFYNVDTCDASGPIRATIDYYGYIREKNCSEFKDLGRETGFLITLNQAKVRLYFRYLAGIIIDISPISYIDIPDNIDCRKIDECASKLSKKPTKSECLKCIENMLGERLVDMAYEDILEIAKKENIKIVFKKKKK